MPLYGNYIANPSFELNTASWSVKHPEAREDWISISTQISRVSTGAVSGSYALRISVNTTTDFPFLPYGRWGGAYTIVEIDPAANQQYTLSWQASNFSATDGSQNHLGIRVGVWAFSGNVTVPEQTSASNTFSGYSPAPIATKAASKSTSRQSLTFTPPENATRLLILFEAAASTWISTWGSGSVPNATCSIDAIKLEQGPTPTSYGDGSYPGWSWSGEPHNSPSRRSLELEASGTITMDGSIVDPTLSALLTADGTITVTGDLDDIIAQGTLEADGSASMDGSIDIWQFNGQIEADGSAAVLGDITIAAIINIEADGTITTGSGIYEPSIEMHKAWGMVADGSISMDGDVTLSFPQSIAGATGYLTFSGDATVDVGLQMTGDGFVSVIGDLEITDAEPYGSFADFAIYGVSESDPYMLGVGPTNAPLATGANGQPWNRVYATFAAPVEVPGSWARAAYAAVGFRFDNMAAGTYQEMSCVQVEPARYDTPGPRDYVTPQKVTPLVIADRANLATGDVAVFIGDDGSHSVTTGGTSPAPGEQRAIQVCTKTADSGTFFLITAVGFRPGVLTTLSCWVRPVSGITDIRLTPMNSDDWNDKIADPVAYSEFEPDGDGWVRMHLTFESRETMIGHFEVDGDDTWPQVFEVAGILWEESDRLQDYFDMTPGSYEYYYRDNGVDPTKGVFWYSDIERKWPVLIRALEAQAPHGVMIGYPEFGKFPHLD